MTSANVFDCNSVKQSQTLNANAGTGKGKVENPEAASIFSSMMNANYSTEPVVTNAGNKDLSWSAKNTDSAAVSGDYERYQYRNRKIDSADEYRVADKISDCSEQLESFEEELVQTVAEDLGIDEDALAEVLEELQMTILDLLNPQNLIQLATQLSSENTPEELLMNVKFADLMQDVANMGEQLMEDLSLAPEQMDELVAQMHILERPEDLSEFSEMMLQNLGETSETDEEFSMTGPEMVLSEGEVSESEVLKGTVDEETKTVFDSQEEQNIEADSVTANGQTETGQEDTRQEEKGQGEQKLWKEPESDQPVNRDKNVGRTSGTVRETQQPAEMAFTVNNAAGQEMTPAMPVAESSYVSIDAMDLIQQIAEHVRVNISEGTTSMEMQLNPENLGKIYLQVSAREGTVHATIAAQNEAVRAALETQIADLRESLNQSGVRVDAIEVTVATHEFERNLEQNQNREKEQGERQQEMSHRRNLNLSSTDELSGIMTEEEALVAQMMRDNGNSVDFTA